MILFGGAEASATTVAVEPWGTTGKGQAVERVTLENDRGMKLSYIDFGAIITSVEVPDRSGKRANVVLSLPDLAGYERNKRRYSAIIGRYAGRIAHAQLPLDGKLLILPSNGRGYVIHSDPDGFDKRVWQRKDFSDATSVGSIFHITCLDGEQGYPGRLDVEVTYRLMRQENLFSIDYRAWTDTPTVINLTNHGFFNLAGAGSSGVGTHRLEIAADRYVATDKLNVPTGDLPSVAGTPFDFRQSTSVAERIAAVAHLPGLDHGLLFTDWTGTLAKIAVLDETVSGRRMEISTTEPSLQLFSGNGFDGTEVGSEGIAYQRHDGLAFETQHLADSPNHPNFPTTELRPGESFHSKTSFSFSVTR